MSEDGATRLKAEARAVPLACGNIELALGIRILKHRL
jgi:hypothetical protein